MRLEFTSFSLSMGGHCNEIVMVARSERIVSRQNGSNRPICNPLKRGVEQNIFQTVQTHVCIAKPLYRLGHDKRKNKAPLHEPPRSTHSLCAVQRETPNFLASILNGSFPCARCLLRSAASFRVNLRSGGRPKILPLARAFARPDLTRSAISALSNCATAPIIWNSISPAGRDVSTASVTDTKSIPSSVRGQRSDFSENERIGQISRQPRHRLTGAGNPSTVRQDLDDLLLLQCTYRDRSCAIPIFGVARIHVRLFPASRYVARRC
jgi:hypothetical protein